MYTVNPRVGLNDIKLGMLRNDVKSILGEPEEVAPSAQGEDESIAWYYWEEGLCFNFDSEYDFRLTTIEVANSNTYLSGVNVIGLSVEEARTSLRSAGIDNLHFSDESSDNCNWGLLAHENEHLNLWFEDGVLESIQIGVYINGEDQECWPQ